MKPKATLGAFNTSGENKKLKIFLKCWFFVWFFVGLGFFKKNFTGINEAPGMLKIKDYSGKILQTTVHNPDSMFLNISVNFII